MAIALTETSKGRPSDSDWLALLMVTECGSKQFEWPLVGQVVINRLEDTKREFRHLNSIADVILQPKQWSYFNQWTDSKGERERSEYIYLEAAKGVDWYELASAYGCARASLGQHRWQRTLGPEVLFCWAPGAMKPVGSDPKWAVALAKIKLPQVPRWKFAYYPEDA